MKAETCNIETSIKTESIVKTIKCASIAPSVALMPFSCIIFSYISLST